MLRAGGIAIIAPVNESLWEHLKMPYWPAVGYLVVELVVLDPLPAVFLVAKAISIYVMLALMISLYWVSVLIVRQPRLGVRLAVDAAIFVTAVACGQLASYAAQQVLKPSAGAGVVGVTLIGTAAVVFAITTFKPARWPIFKDQLTGTYGAPRHGPGPA